MAGELLPVTHAEQEIDGYRKALDEILSEGYSGQLTEETIRHFHRLIMETTSFEAGQYKKEDNYIQERDEEGRISVRFVPVRASETEEAMRQWIFAYHEARQDAAVNRLLLTAAAVVDFLCIHPFTDGSGRVSRLLTTMLLEKEGFDIGRYISVDAKIREYVYGYYEALHEASEGWHGNKSDYAPFIVFIMQILYRCYKELDEKFVDNTLKKVPKHKQIEGFMKNAYVPVAKEEIAQRFPEISVSTIERVLGKLVKEGKIQKIGSFRDARYRKL